MKRNLAAGSLVVALFFLLLEGGLRLSGIVPTQALRSPDLQVLERIPGLFDPGQRFIDRIRPDLPYPVRINSLGFRGGEFALPKPGGTVRVLCLGDSYTFGHYVADEEAFPAVLTGLLRSAGNGEAINGGANGFTIADEVIFLRDRAHAVQPDAIVLVFSQNDIQDLLRPRPMIDVMRDHAALKARPVIGPILKFLQRTALFNGMQRMAASLRVRQMRAAPPSPAQQQELWGRYEEWLQEASRAAGRVPLLIVAWPPADSAGSDTPPPAHGTLAEAAGRAGLPFLDLHPVMRRMAAAGENPWLVPLDGHPSAAGHRAAAAAIHARLVDLRWLPGADTGMAGGIVP